MFLIANALCKPGWASFVLNTIANAFPESNYGGKRKIHSTALSTFENRMLFVTLCFSIVYGASMVQLYLIYISVVAKNIILKSSKMENVCVFIAINITTIRICTTLTLILYVS